MEVTREMKVTTDSQEFQKVTVVLQTQEDVLKLYRLTCDGMYYFLKKNRFGDQVISCTDSCVDLLEFKADLNKKLGENVPSTEKKYSSAVPEFGKEKKCQ